jgi:ubiquinone/menaquinone biosynthesis C-methylase UbiE
MHRRNSNSTVDLVRRHSAESDFHDKKYGKGEGYPRHYAVNPTYPIYQRMLRMVGDLRGKSVLEYGCGEGWISKDLALAGAQLSAFDISAEAVSRTRKLLENIGVPERSSVEQMEAEKLRYPDNSFDTAIGFAILHHLDVGLAIPELHRVLKPGGMAFFAEPLGTNPFINVYRRFTPQYRTADERPLDLGAMRPMLSRFRSVNHTEYYVTALAAVALAYLPFGDRVFPKTNRVLMGLDDGLLRAFPSLGRLAWYTILVLRK